MLVVFPITFSNFFSCIHISQTFPYILLWGDRMLDNENEMIALSVSLAKYLASTSLTLAELAVLAVFFANLSSNLSIIIQARNLKNIPTPDPIIQEEATSGGSTPFVEE